MQSKSVKCARRTRIYYASRVSDAQLVLSRLTFSTKKFLVRWPTGYMQRTVRVAQGFSEGDIVRREDYGKRKAA